MKPSSEQCAAELLDTVPLLMRVIRAQVRSHRGPEMSVPQFRTLAFVARNEGAPLSDVAAHLGLTLPSTSKLVEGLVSAKLTTRKTDATDRRRVSLALTAAGQKKYDAARAAAHDFLAGKLTARSREEIAQIFAATQMLKATFSHHVYANGSAQKPIARPTARATAKRSRTFQKKSHHV